MLVQDFEAGVERAASPETLWRLFAAFFRGTVVQRLATGTCRRASDSGRPRMRAEGFSRNRRRPLLGRLAGYGPLAPLPLGGVLLPAAPCRLPPSRAG